MRRRSAVFLWLERALFLGDRSTTGVHAHYAVELSLALDRRGLTTVVSGGPSIRAASGAVVRSAAPHSLDIAAEKVAVLYLDPASADGAAVHDWLGERSGAEIEAAAAEQARPRFAALFDRSAGLDSAAAACDSLTGLVTRRVTARAVPSAARAPVRDARVERVIEMMESRVSDPPSLAEAAAAVGLSPDRLRTMFSQQVGVPMRRYLLWLRLRTALTEALSGTSMTDAAYAAGFADAAHFTRTCQRMFGLPPSAFAPVDEVLVADRHGPDKQN